MPVGIGNAVRLLPQTSGLRLSFGRVLHSPLMLGHRIGNTGDGGTDFGALLPYRVPDVALRIGFGSSFCGGLHTAPGLFGLTLVRRLLNVDRMLDSIGTRSHRAPRIGGRQPSLRGVAAGLLGLDIGDSLCTVGCTALFRRGLFELPLGRQ